jgi:putative polyhydroxyalkanoate system protein
MADIDIRRAHHMSPADARKAADRMADKLGRKFGLAGDWDGDVLRFERPGVTGSLTMGPKDLHLVVTLGFLLKAMKGSIEQAIQHEMDELFAARQEPAAKPAAKAKKASPPRKKGG